MYKIKNSLLYHICRSPRPHFKVSWSATNMYSSIFLIAILFSFIFCMCLCAWVHLNAYGHVCGTESLSTCPPIFIYVCHCFFCAHVPIFMCMVLKVSVNGLLNIRSKVFSLSIHYCVLSVQRIAYVPKAF